jgi:hypothetical protein
MMAKRGYGDEQFAECRTTARLQAFRYRDADDGVINLLQASKVVSCTGTE